MRTFLLRIAPVLLLFFFVLFSCSDECDETTQSPFNLDLKLRIEVFEGGPNPSDYYYTTAVGMKYSIQKTHCDGSLVRLFEEDLGIQFGNYTGPGTYTFLFDNSEDFISIHVEIYYGDEIIDQETRILHYEDLLGADVVNVGRFQFFL
jgi:hypothetical protein